MSYQKKITVNYNFDTLDKFFNIDPSGKIFRDEFYSENKWGGDPSPLIQYAKENGNAFLGKKHTEEYKLKKSKDRLEYYQTEKGIEQRKQISKTLKEKGCKPPLNTHTKNKKWWNNGKVNKRSIECPGENFIRGRIKGQWKKKK